MGGACAGRVALVTGASRGIGRAIATRLAAEGAAVAICSRPTPGFEQLGTLDAARDALAAFGGDVQAVPFDVGDPTTDRGTLVDRVESELGPVDILVNNAAAGGYHPFLEWDDAQITRAIEVNFWAPWQLTRRVLPGMRERGYGWILNVSSMAARAPSGPPFPDTLPSVHGTVYGGTKAMLDRWTVSLAVECAGDGIAVNTVAPQAAAATEVLVSYSNLADYLYEPLDTMAEAALVLCTADPATLTGQVTTSLGLLLELGREVRDLAGKDLVEGWQPLDLALRMEKMTQHARGEIERTPWSVDPGERT
jgi:NAD(P)-dependent dehydrogenase (short-subunit alcohol dehydrogenase family)